MQYILPAGQNNRISVSLSENFEISVKLKTRCQHCLRKGLVMHRLVLVFLILIQLVVVTATCFAGDAIAGKQTPVAPGIIAKETPQVVIYTLSTCPHCMEAKEYLTANKIPFINREVDLDAEHMDALMKIYDSMGVPEQKRGVPFFVIGNRIRIQGFNREKLQDALKEVTSNPK
jgi:glutaredoxin